MWATLGSALAIAAGAATSCVPEAPEDVGAPVSDPGHVVAGRPILQIAGGAVAFGGAPCGGSVGAERVALANAGDAPLDYDASIVGTGFTITSGARGTIAPGGSASIEVTPAGVPADAIPGVAIGAKIHVTTNDASHGDLYVPVNLVPTGAALQVSASQIGLAGPGSGSTQLTFTNQGNSAVDVALSLPSGTPFNTTPLVHVPARGSASASVGFTSPVDAAADLAIATQGALCGAAPTQVHLTAHSVPAGVPYVAVTTLDFGPVSCGQDASQTFELVNGSDKDLTFASQLEGPAFHVDPASGALARGARITVKVTANVVMTPGTKASAALTFTTTPSFTGNLTVSPLLATANGAVLDVQPATLDFSTAVSASDLAPLQITNHGNAPAKVTMTLSGDASFATSSSEITVPPSADPSSVTVTFRPTSPGTFTGTLSFAAAPLCGPVPPSVALVGTATAPDPDAGPGVDAGLDAPVLDAPGLDAPGLDAPIFDAPVIDSPGFDAPIFDAPVTDTATFDVIMNDAIVGASADEPTSRSP